jgi:mannan endo-1,4-beta-mannosidase
MHRRGISGKLWRTPLGRAAGVALSALVASGCLRLKQPNAPPPSAVKYMDPKPQGPYVVKETDRPSGYFVLDGKPFCFAGTNNYYLTFKSRRMTDDLLTQAKAMGLRLVRVWGFMDRGSLDGSVRSVKDEAGKEGNYFQYWDTATKRPAYNDGENGLARLDYVISKARSLGLTIMPVLTNNWPDFGGMDQYLLWYGLKKHHEFYTDPRVRQAYKDWIAHIVGHKNSIDGVPYRDDPAIFGWELANEPRCKNATSFDSQDGWDKTTLTKWAEEMSAYIKSVDPNHLVSVGDEGFLTEGKKHWAYQGNDGVDHRALSAIKTIDFATFHLYPDNWGTGYAFANDWVTDHIKVAQELGKPTMLEEYGATVRRDEKTKQINWGLERRLEAFRIWNDIMSKGGGNASLFWMLAGIDDDKGQYPDYDGFTVYAGDESARLITQHAASIASDARACRFAQDDPALKRLPPSKFVRVMLAPGKS